MDVGIFGTIAVFWSDADTFEYVTAIVINESLEEVIEPIVLGMFREHHKVIFLIDKTLVLRCHGMPVKHIVEKAPMKSF